MANDWTFIKRELATDWTFFAKKTPGSTFPGESLSILLVDGSSSTPPLPHKPLYFLTRNQNRTADLDGLDRFSVAMLADSINRKVRQFGDLLRGKQAFQVDHFCHLRFPFISNGGTFATTKKPAETTGFEKLRGRNFTFFGIPAWY
jgi:hypothetical protein